MRYVLGALAAGTLLAGVAASQPAEARCYWNGWGWNCWQPGHHYGNGWYHRHHWRDWR